jgi:hypothetical protein
MLELLLTEVSEEQIDGNGGGFTCPSDDFSVCVDAAADVATAARANNCKSNCGTDEYVAICGGVGPGPVPDPPPTCRFDSANPGGSATYCCPCE